MRCLIFLAPAILIVSGCISAGTSELNPVMGGILESEAADSETFTAMLSALVGGDYQQYSCALSELNETILPKPISDVAINGSRDSAAPYNGLFLNDIRDMRWALSNIGQVKQSCIDTVWLQVQYAADTVEQELYIPGRDVYLFYLNAFSKSGFRIWLSLAHTAYDFPYRYDSGNYIALTEQSQILDMFEPHVMEWAEIAEQHNIETFIPSEEANTALLEYGTDLTSLCQDEREMLSSWMQEILPGIRQRFSGKVGFATNDGGPCEYPGSEKDAPDFNYTGYDFIVYKLPFRSVFPTDDAWGWVVNSTIPQTIGLIIKYNISGLVLYETGDTVGKALQDGFAGSLPVRETDEEHQKESYILDFNLMRAYPEQVLGMFFKISGPQPHEPDWNPYDRPAEQVLMNQSSGVAIPEDEADGLWESAGEDGIRAIQFCLSKEMPFDPDYCLDPGYKQLMNKVIPLCW